MKEPGEGAGAGDILTVFVCRGCEFIGQKPSDGQDHANKDERHEVLRYEFFRTVPQMLKTVALLKPMERR